jgi:hypothetical protein
MKTGTLRDVTGMAGYVLTPSGKRLVVVGLINHPQAPAGRPALEALVQWASAEADRGVPATDPASVTSPVKRNNIGSNNGSNRVSASR